MVLLHGVRGTPETLANLYRPYNCADATRRWFASGLNVSMPATIWESFYDDEVPRGLPEIVRGALDLLARASGLSLLGIEIAGHIAAIRRIQIETGSRMIRTCGFSFSGLLTLLLAALMEDAAVAVVSCGLLHDRRVPDAILSGGWVPQSSVLYKAVVVLLAPRPTYFEFGRHDEVVPLETGERFAALAQPHWENWQGDAQLRIEYVIGRHEFNLDRAIPWVRERGIQAGEDNDEA